MSAFKRTKQSRRWTGHTDRYDVLIMKGDDVKQVGIRAGCYNNKDRIIKVNSVCAVCSGLYADGYYSALNEVII